MKKSSIIVYILLSNISFGQHPKFIWPLKASKAYSEINDYYSINNYVDHNPTGGVMDYNGGGRTYDGHNGTDIDLWPFGWSMKNNDNVEVLAAADGVVTSIVENQTDNNCKRLGETGSWNMVIITHLDGSQSWYGHLKANSVIVNANDFVTAGQVIALVASSGSSSFPHLHFEVYDSVGNLVDPYFGSNNPTTTDSWWLNQKPYKEPSILRVLTHSGVPSVFDDTNNNWCPEAEDKKAKTSFKRGEELFVGNAFRDITAGNTAYCSIFRPDGSLELFLPIICPGSYTKWYSNFSYSLPQNAQFGTYKIMTEYNGKTAIHYFVVGCISVQNYSADETTTKGYMAENVINTSSHIFSGANIRYQASLSVRFTDGFRADNGSRVITRLKGCNYAE